MASALLGVVDDDHGDGVAALQLAQIGEQRCHLTAGVLIDAMQTHEGIEHQQARLQVGDGVVEASAVGREIQSHGGCGDDLDVEIGKAEAGGGADAVEPPAHDVERVLGGIEQNAAGAGDRSAIRRAASASNASPVSARTAGLPVAASKRRRITPALSRRDGLAVPAGGPVATAMNAVARGRNGRLKTHKTRELADIIGDDGMTVLWGCAFEDFVSSGSGERNVADDHLKRRGWKESAGARAYLRALRTSVMSLYEVSDEPKEGILVPMAEGRLWVDSGQFWLDRYGSQRAGRDWRPGFGYPWFVF